MADSVREDVLKTFQEDYAEVNGVRLHYVSAGQGGLVLFVHGFPEFWGEWENQLLEFGRDHQAVALDMRGYNLSSKPTELEQYNIKYLTKDLQALAKHLEHDRFILVAHDWGGAVAWSFANRYPNCLERLIIINAPHPAVFARELIHNPAQKEASQYMLLFRGDKAEHSLSKNNYEWLFNALMHRGSKWKMSDEDQQKYLRAWSQPGALTGGLNYYRASPLFPASTPEEESRLAGVMNLGREQVEVKVPTLVIWGELDMALTTGNLKGLEEYVDDLTIKRIPDGTHWVIHEQPDLVNSLIRDFI